MRPRKSGLERSMRERRRKWLLIGVGIVCLYYLLDLENVPVPLEREEREDRGRERGKEAVPHSGGQQWVPPCEQAVCRQQLVREWLEKQGVWRHGGDGGEDGEVSRDVMDMADQGARTESEAKVAGQEAEAAGKIVRLKRKMVGAAEDRVGVEQRRYEEAAGEVHRLDERVKRLTKEMDGYISESDAKSYEAEARLDVAHKLLARAGVSDTESANAKSSGQGGRAKKRGGASVDAGGLLDDVRVTRSKKPRALDAKALESAEARQQQALERDSANLMRAERGLQREEGAFGSLKRRQRGVDPRR